MPEYIQEEWKFEDILAMLQARWWPINSLLRVIDSESCGQHVERETELVFTNYKKQLTNMKKTINEKYMFGVA